MKIQGKECTGPAPDTNEKENGEMKKAGQEVTLSVEITKKNKKGEPLKFDANDLMKWTVVRGGLGALVLQPNPQLTGALQ